MLPFSYLLSFIFKSPFVAYAVISLLGFVISVVSAILLFIYSINLLISFLTLINHTIS